MIMDKAICYSFNHVLYICKKKMADIVAILKSISRLSSLNHVEYKALFVCIPPFSDVC